MYNPAHAMLSNCCSVDPPGSNEPRYLPSQWLRSGYVPVVYEDGSTGWEKLDAHQISSMYDCPVMEDDVVAFYAQLATRDLLVRLSVTFRKLFALNARQWEQDLRGTPNPVTLLLLWRTAADAFNYYTKGKKLP